MTSPLDKSSVRSLGDARMQFDESDRDFISLRGIYAEVMDRRSLVVFWCLLALALAGAWVVLSKPSYRADASVHVDEKSLGITSAFKDLQPLLSESTTVSTQQEILISRSILGMAIQKLKLDIVVEPKYFPVVGSAIASRYSGVGVASPLLGFTSFAWGGEIARVDALVVPFQLADKDLVLKVLEDRKFQLEDDDGNVLSVGSAGTRAEFEKGAIFVSELKARPGTSFKLRKKWIGTSVEDLKKVFVVKEKTKGSGVLEISYVADSVDAATNTLQEILDAYVRQSVEARSVEAEKTLAFLDQQLPRLKSDLDKAEYAYNSYRKTRGSLDLALETQTVLQSVVEFDGQILALRQEKDELRQSFTAEHPRVIAVDNRIARLVEKRASLEKDVSGLPETQQRLLQLARDVEVTTALYTNILNTSQQLRVSKAGAVGDVRVLDVAIASIQPIGPKPIVVLLGAGVLGLVLALINIWGLTALKVTVRDPETIERETGLPVYATVPFSSVEQRISSEKNKAPSILAILHPDDESIESLRGLQASIHFALFDAENNSILITGPSPGVGKSFVSKNLAVILAQVGKRVVLVDADLRRGHINKEFGLGRENGVSEFVSSAAELSSITKSTIVPNLDVVTTGAIPPNPSELMLHERFKVLLDSLKSLYDIVLVDAPPVLAVADAALISKYVGATFMLLRADKHPIDEVRQAVKKLNTAGVEVKGFIFNGLDLELQRHRYGYKGHVYSYSYK